ncbi:hypothetical protein WJX73_004202 [Symbiochloris irregularis]|uniref:Protein kinase domain-containing protein n=1 Tax=Symbiochloris irregularis TaxID=706552 RepID=A0AAW1NMU2_9CHLO
MAALVLDAQGQHLHDRKTSLATLAREPEAVHISKSGFLFKRAKVTRTWLKRWCVVRKGVFRYCAEPVQANAVQERVLSGCIVASWKLEDGHMNPQELFGFIVEDDGGKHKALYCVSEAERDAWCFYFQRHARQRVFVSDLYTVDWRNMLGSGYFAAVVRAWERPTGRQVAMKIMSRSVYKEHMALLGKEVAIMHAMGSHPHLLPLQQVLYAEQRLYLVTEYMDGGELTKRCSSVQPMSEFAAARIMRQLLAALAHLHALRICHTDIKPENILFATRAQDAQIKLIDFSLAVFFHQPAEPCGTPEFMAPELIANPDEVAKTGWGGEVDMWAAGILLFWLLSGHTPFEANTISGIFVNIELGRWGFDAACWAGVSEAAKEVIRSLLRRNPSRRPTAKALLRHPWMAGPSTQQQPASQSPEPPAEPADVYSCEEESESFNIQQIRRLAASCYNSPLQSLAGSSMSLQRLAGNRAGVEPGPHTETSQWCGDPLESGSSNPSACLDAIPESPGTWSTRGEGSASPRRHRELEHSDSAECSPAEDSAYSIQDSGQCLEIQRSGKSARRPSLRGGLHHSGGDSAGEDSPDTCRRNVIEFKELHKVRAILNLRRAMLAASRSHSLEDLVQEAREVI